MNAKKVGRAALLAAGGLAAAWLFCAFLLPACGPFVIGALVAWAAEKPVRLLTRRAHLPRWASSFLCVALLFLLLGGALFLLAWAVLRELSGFLRELPALAVSLEAPLSALEARLLLLAGRLPDGVGAGLREGVVRFFESGAVLGQKLYEWFFSFASGVLKRLPHAMLFAFTAVIASFLSSSELPAVRAWVAHRAPPAWKTRLQTLASRLRATLGGWLAAQLKLMGVTFLLLTAGFLLLRTQYPLLFAVLVTLVDALPVFGVGTALIPWALLSFLRGRVRLGVGLLVLYGAAALTRQSLEPRLVGRQLGLPPLFTLMALSRGFHFLGGPGMLVFPMAAVLLRQLWDLPRAGA